MGEGKEYWATVSVVTGKWVSPLENDGVRYFRTKWIFRVGKLFQNISLKLAAPHMAT